MSKSIHEIIKESLIEELDASNITAGNLTKLLIEAKEDFDSILDSILEELAKEEEFIPEIDDTYFVVNFYGEADGLLWDGYPCDKIALENNAIFKTQEEAEFEAERLKVLRALEKLGRAFELSSLNYFISCKHSVGDSSELIIGCATLGHSCYGKHYFDDEKEARQAIEKIGADRIKKYLFGVEE